MEREPIYALKAGNEVSPLFESPLGLFASDEMLAAVQREYDIPPRAVRGPMSPWAVKRLAEFDGDIPLFRRARYAVAHQASRHRQDRAGRREQPGHLVAGRQGRHPQARNLFAGRCGRLQLLRRLGLANQGLLEFVEMFKAPIKVLHPLLTATQEGNFKGTEGFGAIPFDGVILAHSNESEWKTFRNNKNNEALLDRIFVVKVPYCLRYSEERRSTRSCCVILRLSANAVCAPGHA